MGPRQGCLVVLVACLLAAVALFLWVHARLGSASEAPPAGTGPASAAGEGHATSGSHDGSQDESGVESDGSASGTGATPPADQEGLVVTVERGEAEQVATRLLSSYREAGNCALASSGYLDLFGSVWGCVVQGDGWVDVCIVSEEGSDSRVAVLRLEGAAVARELLQQDV